MTGRIVKKGEHHEQGMILGVMNSVMSLSMIIGPIFAGFLFGFKSNLPFLAAGFFGLIAFLILKIDCKNNNSRQSTADEENMIIEEQQVDLIS